MELNNVVIEVLDIEHGKKVIDIWEVMTNRLSPIEGMLDWRETQN